MPNRVRNLERPELLMMMLYGPGPEVVEGYTDLSVYSPIKKNAKL